MTPLSCSSLRRILAFWLCLCVVFMPPSALQAQQSSANQPSAASKPCPNPNFCFVTLEAKEAWAKEHKCSFDQPKVVCEDTELKPEGVVATAKATVRFADGLIDGLKQQLIDLWEFFKQLFTNPSETWDALKTLGKLIIEDPKGAANLFIALLGDDAAKLITCGAYDQGKVIGKYVSPFFALKVAQLAAKGGKLADAVTKVKNMILSPAEKAKLGIKYIPGVKPNKWRELV